MNCPDQPLSHDIRELKILSLTPAQITDGVQLMASTFLSDPFICALIPDRHQRFLVLTKVWQKLLNYDFSFGHIYTTEHQLGIASWLPPNTQSISLWRSLPLVVDILQNLGWQKTNQLVTTILKIDAYHHRDCPAPHWYLDGLAVSPHYQGKGIGSLLLQPVLQQADRQGESCYLYTTTESAVRFYQRHGFLIRAKLQVFTNISPVWMMMRFPQTQPYPQSGT